MSPILVVSVETAKKLIIWLEDIDSADYDDQYAPHLTAEAAWLLVELRRIVEEKGE